MLCLESRVSKVFIETIPRDIGSGVVVCSGELQPEIA